jgi:hypothetical protein
LTLLDTRTERENDGLEGLCKPHVLARGCGSNWSIWKVAKSGGEPIRLVDSPISCPLHLAVDSVAVYWVDRDGGTISRVAK